jgi:ferredoxin
MSHLQIDWTRCDGHGSCAELLPDVLTLDEWGYPLPLEQAAEPQLPRSAQRRASRAVKACPLAALRVVEG